MSKARDMQKRNARLEFAVRRIPAVSALYPALAEALRVADAKAEARP